MNKYKNNNFPGGLWQEAQFARVRIDRLPGTKRKLRLRNLYPSIETDGSFFFSRQQVGVHESAKASGWAACDVPFS